MDKIEDKITKIINEKNELIDINYLFQLYNQLDIDELIELKYINQKKPKTEYLCNTENKENWYNKPQSWHTKRINHGTNDMVLEYALYRKLEGTRPYDSWRRINH